jgi:hypothetical protein
VLLVQTVPGEPMGQDQPGNCCWLHSHSSMSRTPRGPPSCVVRAFVAPSAGLY